MPRKITPELHCYPPVPDKPLLIDGGAIRLPSTSGIYFIWQNDEIFYIGKSINLKRRCSTSHHAVRKRFKVSWIELPEDQLSFAEAFYIGVLQPPACFNPARIPHRETKSRCERTGALQHVATLRVECSEFCGTFYVVQSFDYETKEPLFCRYSSENAALEFAERRAPWRGISYRFNADAGHSMPVYISIDPTLNRLDRERVWRVAALGENRVCYTPAEVDTLPNPNPGRLGARPPPMRLQRIKHRYE